MRLDFSGAPAVPASPDHVWARLMDYEFVASCAPGVESVEALDDNHFAVVSGFGVGKIRARFHLDVELFDLVPPRSAKMSVRGKTPGSAVDFESSVSVDPAGSDHTVLTWAATAHIHGRIASIGARLMSNTAQRLTETFWERFAERAAIIE